MEPQASTGDDPFDVVCITLDVDWAAEEVLDSVVRTLEETEVKATFFATHASDVLTAAEGDQFEIGLHPNFNDCRGDFEEPLARVSEAYPNARGGRSHSLYTSSQILALYMRHGLVYESNTFLYNYPLARPVLRYAELMSIPFTWSDDKHIELSLPLDEPDAHLELPGVKVLNFHPIHVFLNTTDQAHYERSRPHHRDPEALRELVNRDGLGVATMLEQIVAEISSRGLRTARMQDVAERYRAERS
jgi:hypothetical protein